MNAAIDPETHVHHALLAARLPRLLGIALASDGAQEAALQTLSTEVLAIAPELGDAFDAVVAACRSGDPKPENRDVAGFVAVLDARASEDRSLHVREVGDACLLLLGDPARRETCRRLAASAREELARVSAASLVRSQAAVDGLPLFNPRELKHLVEEMELERDDVDDEIDIGSVVSRPAAVNATHVLLRDWYLAARHLVEEANYLVVGLHVMAGGYDGRYFGTSIPELARQFGEQITRNLRNFSIDRANLAKDRQILKLRKEMSQAQDSAQDGAQGEGAAYPETLAKQDGRVMVCPDLPKNSPVKAKEIARGYEAIMGCYLPLARTPDLANARKTLVAEFPHCEQAVDQALRHLVGKPYVELPPLLLRGPPGVGKSRFARRLGEVLGVGVMRLDGSNDGGASFGGTERRWYSTEPNRPFMACARFGEANPLLLIDEIDKAPTRSDYGRLWDAMLQFMEPETAARYRDPSMQMEMDLSHVSIVATANATETMPGPLLDRFAGIIDLPKPGRRHLPALAAHLGRELATQSGWDERFVEPFSQVELDLMHRAWRGDSVRRLRRIVQTVIRGRERAGRATLN